MKNSKRIFAMIIAVALIVVSMFAVGAASYDTNTKGSFSVTCTKPGYTFTVYKVADLLSTTTSTFETKYDSLVPEIADEILSGDTSAVLSALDGVAEMPSTATVIGTYKSDDSGVANFTNLDHGIYYIKATNFPAGVKSVTNSVVSLPYYDGTTWQYTISDIELASKVNDGSVTTEKTITNSTKGNVNYTDVSLGDTVNFEIRSSSAGSESMKLGSYVVYDDMSAGLTLNKNSFNVALLDENGDELFDLDDSDYVMTVTSEGANQNTLFNVALTEAFLQGADFYAPTVYYTSVTYSATLNENAVVGTAGNPNTDVKVEYSNKNGVTDSAEGNTVYVYTYAVKTIKTDKATTLPLVGAEFALFKSEADANSYLDKTENNAQNNVEPIGTGVSDADGLVLYYNAEGDELRLASGTYFAVETKAPANYMVYGKPIAIEIAVGYGATFVDGTWVTSAPTDGYGTADVADPKIIVPVTGGTGTIIFSVVATLCAGGAIVFLAIHVIKKKREAKATN
ncbi:MAG: SpaH/EbpB family LPXTG-anchored major pilin [Clostridia bacterium]|nr:SpaH/EbpB family LPXTG-anchored major pilin [Clostridia bacterium]